MTKITEVCISIERMPSIGRTSFMHFVTDAERFGGKITTGSDFISKPCECGYQLYSVDIEYPKTPEFHSFEICPICQRCYPLMFTFGLQRDGKPYQPTGDEVYEEYVADMTEAGVGSYILPRSWFEAHQHAIAFTLGEDNPEPPAPLHTEATVQEVSEAPGDYPTKDGNARADWLDQIEAEVEAEKKANRIADMATALDKLEPADFLQIALFIELLQEAQPGAVKNCERMMKNFAEGKGIYDGVYTLK